MSPLVLCRSYLLPGLLLFLMVGHLWGQHKAWRQYTIADGLPGNAVYDMLQDSKGYMWFVTDQGICRFNGYDFIQPVDTTFWAGSEAFIPVEDDKGRIWFNRINQSLWFVENDTVKEWKFNPVLDHYRKEFSIIDQLGFAENGSIWIGLSARGFLVVELNGQHKIIHASPYPNLEFTRLKTRIIHAFQFAEDQRSSLHESKIAEVINLDGGHGIVVDQIKEYNGLFDSWGAWLLRNDTVLTLFNGMYSVFHQDNMLFKFQSKVIAEKVIQTPNGEILLASHTSPAHGLFKYATLEDFKSGNGENILREFLVTDVYADREGGWWASTKNGGVFYCKNPGIHVFDISSGFTSSNMLRLSSDGEEMVYAGLDSKNVVSVNRNTNKTDILPTLYLEDDMIALFYETGQNRLWCSSHLKYWDGAKWTGVTYASENNPLTSINAKHISVSPSGEKLWMSSSHGLYELELKSLSARHYRGINLNSSSNRTYAVVEDANGTIWVATMQGLKVLRGETFELPPFDHPAFQSEIRDLVLLLDGGIAVGTLGKGILIRYPDGNLLHFTYKDGLSSDDITMLKVGPSGELFACTNSGLNRLTPLKDRKWKIQNIGVKQGLPSDVVNDIVVLEGEMWIGTDKGLVRMKEIPDAYPVSVPVIEKFEVDNREISKVQSILLPYDRNNVTIHYHSLHFRSDGDIRYRYRLSEADTTFYFTTQREVNYAKLAPGKYTFEVQAEEEDLTWSNPAIISFEISYPWWVRWWFISLVALFLIGLTAFIIRNRNRADRRASAISLKMKDLEMAALRAQINPHFIFNCLGSIQQFIIENDSASATSYLTRFAKLIRLALHSSIDGKHSLADEIAMLDNYLALEQMRFKGRFQYQIDAAGIGDVDDIHIPPMLLQPFLENAVKHGIGKAGGEGKINIAFIKKDNLLLAVITDNGPGFSTEIPETKEIHKSVGLSLTRHRLDLLSGTHEGNSYTQENVTGPNGEVQGARVEIRIPLN